MKKFFEKYDLFFYLGVTLLCLLVMATTSGATYRDTDSYMWANRMIEWISSASFAEQPFMLSNYPKGEILHWTRPLDMFWYGLYWFFKNTHPLKEAVFLSGIFLSPVIGILFVLTTYFAIKPIYKGFYRLLFILGIFFPFPFQAAFRFFNPDHHVLILLFQWISFAFLIRWICFDKKKSAILGGVFVALSIWTTVESWIFFFMMLSAFLLGFVFFQRKLKDAISFVFGTFVTLVIAVLLNPPAQGLFYLDLGRISFAYVAMAGLVFLNLKIMQWYQADKYSVLQKIASLIPIGFVSLCWMGLLYYPLFTSQLADVWMYRIQEMQSPLNSFSSTLYYLGSPFLGVVLWIACLWRKRKIDLWFSSVGIFLLGYFILTCYSIRFCSFLSLYALIPFVDWIKLETKDMKKENVVPNHVMGVSFCYFLGAILIISCADLMLHTKQEARQPLVQNNYLLNNGTKTVLSDVFYGPKIIFETGRPVVATPYHRNEEGILDSHHIFYGMDMDKVYNLLKKHQVEDVLLTVRDIDVYYKNAPETSFYKRIISQKNIPSWFDLKQLKKEKGGYLIWGKIIYQSE